MSDTAETAAKSIIDPRYRDGRYKNQDWLGQFIQDAVGRTKTVTKSEKDGDEVKTSKVEKPDGIDVDKLFALAKANGLDVTKYDAQRSSHGFAGRFRMTVRNMLQASVKRRHGINGLDGAFVSAPADWLKEKGAPEEATHTPEGNKIPKAKEGDEAKVKAENEKPAPKAAKAAKA